MRTRLGKRRLIAFAAAALVIAVAAGIGYSAIPNSSTHVISGCYEKKTGLLRVIDAQAGKTCLSFETPISWNQAGPAGKDGAPGTPGTNGRDGAPGTPGADGNDGAPGLAGAAGKDGAPGVDGQDGLPGANGVNGFDGKNGVSVTSEALASGDTSCANGGSKFTAANGVVTYACNGAPGTDGVDGADGAPGAQGPPGQALASLLGLSGLPCTVPGSGTGIGGGVVVPPRSGASYAVVESTGDITLRCLLPDVYEPNDTRATKTNLIPIFTGPNSSIQATLSPAGDEDWYQVNPASGAVRVSNGALMDVYSSAGLVATGVACFESSASSLDIRVYGPTTPYSLGRSGFAC